MWITSIRLTLLTIISCSLIYPAVVVGIAKVVASETRLGSLLYNQDGAVIGSRLIAQSFTEDRYFWPRPSAVKYDASAAGGSNLSPQNPLITERAAQIIATLKPTDNTLTPSDLVLASGSGLDPHISLEAALFQVERVAKARGVSDETIQQLVRSHAVTVDPFSSEQIVNVLELNLAIQ